MSLGIHAHLWSLSGRLPHPRLLVERFATRGHELRLGSILPGKRGGAGGVGFRSEIKEGATASRALRAALLSSGDQTDDYTLFGP